VVFHQLARGNLLNTGEAVTIDSDLGGFSVTGGTLTSPSINVADIDSTLLEFASWFRTFSGGDVYNVEISVDAGAWETILPMVPTNQTEKLTVDLAPFITGATSFAVRWNYQAFFEWYAFVDDVEIGGGLCVPRAGSIVKGLVTDANTGLPINGAVIETDIASDSTVSFATESADTPDGYFSLFIADGFDEVRVSSNKYVTANIVPSLISLATPVALDAGQISIDSELPVYTVTLGRDGGTNSYAIENTGNADAEGRLLFSMLPPAGINAKALGPFHPSARHFGPKSLSEVDTKKMRHRIEGPRVPTIASDLVDFFSVAETTFAWGIGVSKDTGNFWVGDLAIVGAPVDAAIQYDTTGTATGEFIDTTAISGVFAADMAYNSRTGMFWQVEVGNANCIHELDPVTKTVTGSQICPRFGTSQRGLAYDPLTNTFYSGSWNDSVVHQFDTTGEILRSVNIGLPISGLALNPVSGSLFVLSNAGVSGTLENDVTVHDTTTPELDAVAAINFPLADLNGDGLLQDTLSGGQSGLAIDCDGNLWTASRENLAVVGITTGETDTCDWRGLPWLKLSEGNNYSVAANSIEDVAVEFDVTDLPLGTYQGQLIASTTNTPYPDSDSLITLNITAPNIGTLGFSTSGPVSVENGSAVNLTVNRADGADFAVSVDYATSDATALAGVHYQGSTGTLNWADGDTAPKTITISTINSVQTNDLGFNVVLSNANGGAAVTSSTTSVVIFRDPPQTSGVSGGGSFGYGLLFLLGFAGVARRRRYK